MQYEGYNGRRGPGRKERVTSLDYAWLVPGCALLSSYLHADRTLFDLLMQQKKGCEYKFYTEVRQQRHENPRPINLG